MQTRRFLDDSPEMTGNVKIQGVASVSLYSLPVNTATKFLGGGKSPADAITQLLAGQPKGPESDSAS